MKCRYYGAWLIDYGAGRGQARLTFVSTFRLYIFSVLKGVCDSAKTAAKIRLILVNTYHSDKNHVTTNKS